MQIKKLFYVQFCGKSYIFHQNAARSVPRGILFWYKSFLPHMCNFSLGKTLTRVFQCPPFDQCLPVIGEFNSIFINVCHSL